MHYRPRTAILNNLEFDHADIFDDLAAIERQFHHLIRTVPPSGPRGVQRLEESLDRVLHQGLWSELRTFGAAVSDFTAVGEPHAFDVLNQGQPAGRVEWALSGVHNQLNALAAIAAAEHVGVAPADAARALASFENVRRRMEVRGTVARAGGDITVYDDFAHHPTAIRTTLDGLAAPPGQSARAHPGGVRAAQQHHEAGHDEVAAALEPGSGRPRVLPLGRAGLGRRRGAGPHGRAGPGGQEHRRAGGAGGVGRSARRPHRLHEQRRVWRRARAPAESALRA